MLQNFLLLPLSHALALQNAATSCVDNLEQVAFQMSSFAGYHGNSEAFTNQLIRCHALVLEQELCVRVNTIPAYMEINRMVSCIVLLCFSRWKEIFMLT